jgi:WD40 repeat protein
VDLAPEVREVASGDVIQRLDGPTFAYEAVVSADGSWAGSHSLDNIVVWDLARGRAVGRLAGHTQGVTALAASPTDRVLVSAGHDRTLRLWDAGKATPLDDAPSRDVSGLDMASPQGVVVVTYRDGAREAWRLQDGAAVDLEQNPPAEVTRRRGLDWAPSADGRRAAIASWHAPTIGIFTLSEATGVDEYIPARLEVLDTATSELLAVLEDPHAPLTALAMTATADRVIAASWDGTVSVWPALGGDRERRLLVGAATAGVTLITRGRTSGQMVDTLAVADTAPTTMVVTADDHLVVAIRNGSLQEWDLATGVLLGVIVLESPAVALATAERDSVLVVADERGRITCLNRMVAAQSS